MSLGAIYDLSVGPEQNTGAGTGISSSQNSSPYDQYPHRSTRWAATDAAAATLSGVFQHWHYANQWMIALFSQVLM